MRRHIVGLVVFAFLFTSPLSATTRRWINTGNGANGSWTDGGLWSPSGVPNRGDDLLITSSGNYSCKTNASFQPSTLVVGGGSGTRAVEVSPGSTLTMLTSAKFNQGASISVKGRLDGGGEITVNQDGNLTMHSNSTLAGTGEFFTNADSTFALDGARVRERDMRTGGDVFIFAASTMSDGASLTNLAQGVVTMNGGITRGDSSAMLFDNQGTLIVRGSNVPLGIDFTNSGTVSVQSGTLAMGTTVFRQTGGTTTIASNASIAGPVDLAGGTLTGTGTVTGDVTNGGRVDLAGPVAIGTMTVNGNFTQTPSGVIEFKIGGVDKFDRFLVSGVASLAGRISIRFLNGYVPAVGTRFPIMTFGTRIGDFSFYDGTDLGGVELVPDYTSGGLSMVAQVKRPCAAGKLCLNEGRFEVSLSAVNPRDGKTGAGQPVTQNDIFGYFSIPELTQNPSNPEVFVKVIDGRQVNGKFWVFYGTLTDFGLTLTVVDTVTKATKVYTQPGEGSCGAYDAGAFAKTTGGFALARADELSTELHVLRLGSPPLELDPLAPAPEAACVTTETSLCLLGSRFAVTLTARDHRTGKTATGRTIARNDLFGYFTLPELTGNPDNVEVFVKVLDGRQVNGKFWVFFGGLTDVEYTLRVRDVETLAEKIYVKPAESPCGKFDTGAF